MNKRIFITMLFGYVAVVSLLLFAALREKNKAVTTQNKASELHMLNTSTPHLFANVAEGGNVRSVDYFVESDDASQSLYFTQNTGIAAVYEIMEENPNNLLPADFADNVEFIKQKTDTNKTHYYFAQTIQDIPIYASQVRFDLNTGNRLVGLEGTFVVDAQTVDGAISEEQATQKALESGQSAFGGPVVVCSGAVVEETIVNYKFLGLSEDDRNILTYWIPVCSSGEDVAFNTEYFISKETGNIVLEQNQIYEALNRKIYNCSSGSCVVARNEGSAAVNDREVDNSYDILGDVYRYYFDNYQRDSYDGRGATIIGKAKQRANVCGFPCPNACWNGYEMQACTGLVAHDVWAHELTHAVVARSARFVPGNQAGALNEGFSDIFGFAVDPDDWTMGEATSIGVIRNFANPGRVCNRFGCMPDRMFSSNFYCGSGDGGGVHQNSTVLTHGFYRAVTGGNFNGCTLTATPKEKVLPVMYKALTNYLSPTANYGNAYNAIVKACADLYGSTSSECRGIIAAFQAVEMDQQPTGVQAGGIKCSNPRARKAPTCSGAAPIPTYEPNPTTPPVQSTPTVVPTVYLPPTALPTQGVGSQPTPFPPSQQPSGNTRDDTPLYRGASTTDQVVAKIPKDSTVTIIGRMPGWLMVRFMAATGAVHTGWVESAYVTVVSPSATAAPQPTPTTQGSPTATVAPTAPIPADQVTLTISLKFPGISTARSKSLPVKIGLSGGALSQPTFKQVAFEASQTGVWTGRVSFPVTSGDYCVLVKGPMHIQRKICDTRPSETVPGSYRPASGSAIQLDHGETAFDFTGVIQSAGDLPLPNTTTGIFAQNGIANSLDIVGCRSRVGSTQARDLEIADVDGDGAVSAQDCAHIESSLAYKFDDE